MKYVGAAYLVYVGIRKLLEKDEPVEVVERPPRSGRRVFGQGVVVNVLNPKTALFFLAFLPQFVDRDRPVWIQTAVLGLCWIGLGLLSDGAYALAGGTIGGSSAAAVTRCATPRAGSSSASAPSRPRLASGAAGLGDSRRDDDQRVRRRGEREASTSAAAAWIAENRADVSPSAPQVTTGEVALSS